MPWEGVELDRTDRDAEDAWPTQELTARSRSSGRSQKDYGTVWCETVHDRGPEVIFPIPDHDEDQLGRRTAAVEKVDDWRAPEQLTMMMTMSVTISRVESKESR